MNNEQLEEFDKFGEKLYRFLQDNNIETPQPEQLPEVMASLTLFAVKEGSFEEALNMIKQSVKNLSLEPSLLNTWRNEVQERLREASNDELGIDDSQRQQLQRALLGNEKNEEFEEFDKFGEKLNRFLQDKYIETPQPEQLPEVMASVTLFTVKEGGFEEALNMIKQSVKNLSLEPSLLASWRNEVQERLREASNDELGLDDSQRQQLERALLGLDE